MDIIMRKLYDLNVSRILDNMHKTGGEERLITERFYGLSVYRKLKAALITRKTGIKLEEDENGDFISKEFGVSFTPDECNEIIDKPTLYLKELLWKNVRDEVCDDTKLIDYHNIEWLFSD